MILLGIDPGTRLAGYAIISKHRQKISLLNYGCLNMISKKELMERVGIFYDFFSDKIQKWNVTDLAIETPFYGLNAATFGKLSYLRGILYLLAYKYKLELSEFAPHDIKKSMTGSGVATKDQVACVILKFFPGIKLPAKSDDITDALGISLCGAWKNKLLVGNNMAKKKKVVVAKGVKILREKLKKVQEKEGSSNAGKYKNVAPANFVGAAGGASKYSFPINTLARARNALARAHYAPDPEGLKRAVYKKYPQLNPRKKRKFNEKKERNGG